MFQVIDNDLGKWVEGRFILRLEMVRTLKEFIPNFWIRVLLLTVNVTSRLKIYANFFFCFFGEYILYAYKCMFVYIRKVPEHSNRYVKTHTHSQTHTVTNTHTSAYTIM